MLNEMSEAQRLMLQVAATRKDRFLEPPAKARGAVAKTIAGKLIDAGWAKEITAPNGAPIWRKDAASGDAFTLKLTARGLKAVAAVGERTQGGDPAVPAAAENAPPKLSTPRSSPTVPVQPATAAADSPDRASPAAARAPRAGSKLADVLARLSAENGATISELMTATDWLEHSTRAALTGLRRRGFALNRAQRGDGTSMYRVAVSRGEAAK